jgi:hypothetical protein
MSSGRLNNPRRIKLIEKIIWLSTVAHSLTEAMAPTKDPNYQKPSTYFGKTFRNQVKNTPRAKYASVIELALDPSKLGAFLTGIKKNKGKKIKRNSHNKNLTNMNGKKSENVNHVNNVLNVPPTQLPTNDELEAFAEQLEHEINKQTRRNQRYSVSRIANQSFRKQAPQYSTRKVKYGH